MEKILFIYVACFLSFSFFMLHCMEDEDGVYVKKTEDRVYIIVGSNNSINFIKDVTDSAKQIFNPKESETFNNFSLIAFFINEKKGSLHTSKKINISDRENNTLLYWAIERNNYDMVQFLLEKKANPNFCSHDQKIPLCLAAEKGYLPIVKLLVNNKADINAKVIFNEEEKGMNPILLAAQNNRLDLLKKFLSK